MRIWLFLLLVVAIAACTPKTASKVDAGASAVYSEAVYHSKIEPMFQRSCTPCHFPAQEGRKLPLDTYQAVRAHLPEILGKVELSPDEEGYMPFKQKKPGLSVEEIALLRAWASGEAKP